MTRSVLAAGVLAALAGCSGPPAPPPAGVAATADGDHGHQPSAHGGIIVPVGRDSYHAEAVFEKGGVLRLYTLGHDEAKVLEIEAQPLAAFVKAEGGAEAVPFTLKPAPQPGDRDGMTSQFVGELPPDLAGRKVEVTIPAVRIGGERFRVGFKSAGDEHATAAMPAKASDSEEQDLYLKPGGKYTAEDIKANGSRTASQAFKGFKAAHDLHPKAGDPVCPVTDTKANPKCSWVIGGKKYEFCCPPCVDEFLRLAKDKPDEIKPPEAYRKD
jgi:hypothetical protein